MKEFFVMGLTSAVIASPLIVAGLIGSYNTGDWNQAYNAIIAGSVIGFAIGAPVGISLCWAFEDELDL